jgi:hypothetical protein
MSAAVPSVPMCLAVALARSRSGMSYEQLQTLAERVAPVVDGDRQFFERHPRRRYRLRRADPIEVALHELLTGAAIKPGPERSIFVVVSNIAPAVTPRFFILGPAAGETDLSDAEAHFVFVCFVPEHMQGIEAALRAALSKGGGAA